MKELDNFLAKVGTDKILHHVVGALICALITFVVILQDAVTDLSAVPYVIIGTVAVLFLSIVKETVLDDKPDWMDVVWSVSGCIWVYAAVSIGILFN